MQSNLNSFNGYLKKTWDLGRGCCFIFYFSQITYKRKQNLILGQLLYCVTVRTNCTV